MWSWLHFFGLRAHILTIFGKKIPYFDTSRQKRVSFNCFATKQCLGMLTCSFRLSLALFGSYWTSPCLSLALCDSHSGSHWLSLPLAGILWPSLAHYCSLFSRIQPLLGSHRRCHNDALCPALFLATKNDPEYFLLKRNCITLFQPPHPPLF